MLFSIAQDIHDFADAVCNVGDGADVAFDFHANGVDGGECFVDFIADVIGEFLHALHETRYLIECEAEERGEPESAEGEDDEENVFGFQHMPPILAHF